MENNCTKTYRFDEICPFVREVGRQKGDSWKNRKRKIYDHQFMFCFKGKAHITIGDKYYPLKQGSLVLIRPNVSHTFYVDEEEPSGIYYVHFDYFFKEDYEKINDFYNIHDNYIKLFGNIPLEAEHIREVPTFENEFEFPEYMDIKDMEHVEKILRSMYKSYIQMDVTHNMSAKRQILELFETILKQKIGTRSYSSANHKMLVAQMKEYVASNYYRKLMPKEVALSTNLCMDHASRIFSKNEGMRLVEYIARFRISKAKRLMLESDLSIEQIAYMVGFANQWYFSRTVKKYEGQSPAALRTMIRTELGMNDDKGDIDD